MQLLTDLVTFVLGFFVDLASGFALDALLQLLHLAE